MTLTHSSLLNSDIWTPQVNFKPSKATVTYNYTPKSPSLMDKDNGVCAAAMQSGDY